MRVTFVSGSAVAFANAGVFWVLAFAANLGVIVDAKILRLGVGARPDLDDDTVALPLGKGGSGNKCVPGFLEIERGFAGRGFRDDLDDLLSGSDRLHALVVEGDAYLLVGLHEELGMEWLSFEHLAAFRTGNDFVAVIVRGKGSGCRDSENGHDGLQCFHGWVLVWWKRACQ